LRRPSVSGTTRGNPNPTCRLPGCPSDRRILTCSLIRHPVVSFHRSHPSGAILRR